MSANLFSSWIYIWNTAHLFSSWIYIWNTAHLFSWIYIWNTANLFSSWIYIWNTANLTSYNYKKNKQNQSIYTIGLIDISKIYNYLYNKCLSPLNVASSNPVHGKVYSIQHYLIVFQWIATGWWFLWVLRFPPPINLTYCWRRHTCIFW